jgi:hypothetical protein
MFFAVRDFSNASDVHSYKCVYSTFLPLFNKLQESLICLKALLKGLKQDTSKGYRAWEVWLGKEMISKPEFMATVTTSKVTCEL